MTTATTVKERPILFKPELVRAILEGRKTMTRRLVKPQPPEGATVEPCVDSAFWNVFAPGISPYNCQTIRCPFGKPGDRLWVRETWAPSIMDPECEMDPKTGDNCTAEYRATDDGREWVFDQVDADGNLTSTPIKPPWRSPIYMPRWACRLVLEVTEVRVERLQDISERDAKAEGVQSEWSDDGGETPGRYLYFTDATPAGRGHATAVKAYAEAWDAVNGARASWSSNPWVWVVSFRKVEP